MASKLSLVRATMADKPRLSTFVVDNFYPYEPMCVASGTDCGHGVEVITHGFGQGRTLLAVDGDDLLGFAINVEVTSDEYNHRKEYLAGTQCELCVICLKFWAYAEKVADFWSAGATKAMSLDVLCVSVEARGRGIGQALIEGSRQMAREDGYPLFRMDCTSYYAARLAESAGMTRVFSLPYEDYKDENGEVVFKVEPPHKALNIFKQRL